MRTKGSLALSWTDANGEIAECQAKESEGDVLSNPSPPQFKHRYLDPNHPATNGGLLGLISGGKLTPNVEESAERTRSMLDGYKNTVQEQQSAMIANLRQQLSVMHLPAEQEQAYIKQYEDAFRLQDQQMTEQEEALNKGLGQRKITRV